MSRTLKSLALLSAAGLAGQSHANAEPRMVNDQHVGAKTWTVHHENVLGTSMEMTIRAVDFTAADRVEAAVLRSIDADKSVLSAWDSKSELSQWMRTRGEAVTVSNQLIDVLSLYEQWRRETDGALDASAETALRLWKQASAEGRMPTDTEMAEASMAMKQEHWVVDRANSTATRLTDTPLALASFTKSYIAERAAKAALAAGATGITLNVGGDIVVRGDATQVVAIANPSAHAENDRAMDEIIVRDRFVATSGSYRRGVELGAAVSSLEKHEDAEYPAFANFPGAVPPNSHIIDPRTARPVGHVASATVVAKDAETAGALATAFSVLSDAERDRLAAKHPDVAYLIITNSGKRIASPNWRDYQTGTVMPAAYVASAKPAVAAKAGVFNQDFELVIGVELNKPDSARYRKPYVAVWVEDKDHFPVRTVALWYDGRQRWLPELKSWYRDNQVRQMAEGTDITRTVTSATRSAGDYTLKWDGKDNEGKLVQAGTYTVCVEIAREHGGYDLLKKEIDFNGKPAKADLPGKEEGKATLDYRKR